MTPMWMYQRTASTSWVARDISWPVCWRAGGGAGGAGVEYPLAEVGLEVGDPTSHEGRRDDGQRCDDQRPGAAVDDEPAVLHPAEAEVDRPADELGDDEHEAAGADDGDERQGGAGLIGAGEGQQS